MLLTTIVSYFWLPNRINLTRFKSKRRELLGQGKKVPPTTLTDKYGSPDETSESGVVHEKLEHYYDASRTYILIL